MEKENGLKNWYKHVYLCERCAKWYGCDKKEKGIHLCPICEGKIK